ncbi:MAG: glycosyltransferase family 4 protein [Candidatus Rokubacteria bacterium]|nr:glycosyltransferase family 4 protein [Candidatus Rokubacteria bacterium]
MSNARRVLFVGHDASRTGAPILLLHFLRWFKVNTDIPFDILLREGGELRSDFEEVGPVTVLGPWPSRWDLAGLLRRRWLLARLAAASHGLVYSNTVTNGHVVQSLARGSRPVVSHIHELESIIRSFGTKNFDLVSQHTRAYVACSNAVRDNLVEKHRIDPGAIEVVHEFIQIPSVTAEGASRSRARVFRELGIPAGALVVGASGTRDWRKSPDLFIQLAQAVRRRCLQLPVYFVWVGGSAASAAHWDELHYDIRGVGMEDQIRFVESRPNAIDVFCAFDVFALVSREDPYPLVCLEAASLGKPIVCFDGSGGARELVEHDAGFVVPYLDIETMAARTSELLGSEQLRRSQGVRAASKVRARHAVSVAAPKILKIIERYS